ncbi:FHA domain-containing protein [Planktothrix sp. FACHB-1355]|uniref:FHA domain-containing protein n=1 Tax=Aerosakkonema funiforme FACHB-1375 TaxID=2949571 RepID=A0A926VGJ6_9CYAN|nr:MULTISPECIES: FHA domain-containing protein [Oscillatoriales]MBD2183300.1 FHA domain-containing protein [Aerosakkonema funiforme FACHB-1375]MBD3560334.1 FHA domain-containing protein [Planktothrix sp. FACHB-1355]
MIVCPNCNHQNPDGAVQCEACYTPLPATTNCPNCGATVQTDASFCGQCGFNLQATNSVKGEEQTAAPGTVAAAPTQQVSVPDLIEPDPLIEPLPLQMSSPAPVPQNPGIEATAGETPPAPPPAVGSEQAQAASPAKSAPYPTSQTRLQQQTAKLLHLQTKTDIELPQNLPIVHIGKPNDQIPPDIDVSGFPNSEVVSRIHADIRIEGDAYYIEDVGSSNGTYINHTPLPRGNRHRLRSGDRIALGKGDLVTFLFQIS